MRNDNGQLAVAPDIDDRLLSRLHGAMLRGRCRADALPAARRQVREQAAWPQPSRGSRRAGGVAMAVETGAVACDPALAIYPHPARSDTIGEAAAGFPGGAIHLQRESQ